MLGSCREAAGKLLGSTLLLPPSLLPPSLRRTQPRAADARLAPLAHAWRRWHTLGAADARLRLAPLTRLARLTHCLQVEKESAEKQLKELMARFKLRKALLHWRHRKLTLSFRSLVTMVFRTRIEEARRPKRNRTNLSLATWHMAAQKESNILNPSFATWHT